MFVYSAKFTDDLISYIPRTSASILWLTSFQVKMIELINEEGNITGEPASVDVCFDLSCNVAISGSRQLLVNFSLAPKICGWRSSEVVT